MKFSFFRNLFFSALVSAFLFSCGNEPLVETKFSLDSVYVSSQPLVSPDSASTELALFQNIEMMEYCVLLPLKEFKEDDQVKDQVKAKHGFVRIKNPTEDDYISVQGFLIDSKEKIKLKDLYERDILELQESGLAIDTSYVDAVKNFFIIKGYQPNFMEKKFFKIVWLAEDEIVLTIGFNKKDSLIWEKRLSTILQKGISCQ